jgi:thioredoxin-like negative regulator of GroEL
MIGNISSEEEFNQIKAKEGFVLFYFSHDDCNVCKVLKPKVHDLLMNSFSKVEMYYVNTHITPAISGQNSIFTVPTIIVYFNGHELFRKSRNIGVSELASQIQKPYEMVFSE